MVGKGMRVSGCSLAYSRLLESLGTSRRFFPAPSFCIVLHTLKVVEKHMWVLSWGVHQGRSLPHRNGQESWAEYGFV